MWFTFVTARLFHSLQLPTPLRGDAVEFMFRREQSNSRGGTLTRVPVSFTGAATEAIAKPSLAGFFFFPALPGARPR